MPIYEYLCSDCGNKFEKLVLKPGSEEIACPACGASRVTQEVSMFAPTIPGRTKPAPRPHSEYPHGPGGDHHHDHDH